MTKLDRYEEYKKGFLEWFIHSADQNIKIAETIKSPIEQIMYLSLVHLRTSYGLFNIRIARQVKIENFTVDFLVQYNGKNVVVECDGHEWHEKTKEQASKDKRRDRELQKLGHIVLRYTGSDIYNDPNKVLDDMVSILGEPFWFKKEGAVGG